MDGGGIWGLTLHYVIVLLFAGGALLLFTMLWFRGKLDMDEEPKIEMMEEDR